MIADLTQSQNLLQDVDNVDHLAILIRFVELLLSLKKVLVVNFTFLLLKLQLNNDFFAGRQVEDLVAAVVDRILGSSQGAVFENGLQPYNTERIPGLGVVHDILVPHFSLVKRSQAQKLEKRPDIVQLVLDGSSGEADSTFSLEVAGSSRDNRGRVLDETRKGGTPVSDDDLLLVPAKVYLLCLI